MPKDKPTNIDLDDPALYIGRDISWLAFNRRVLGEATSETNPLLERVKFLAIGASNLDEFFMVRVGGLQLQSKAGAASRDPAGLSVSDQLRAIGQRTSQMLQQQYATYLQELEPLLAKQGIEAEIIDVVTLKPLDMPTISASVEKTGRCVIIHEAPLTMGAGAEIAARLADGNILDLLAPIKRVTGYDTVMPLPKMEGHYLPSVARISAAAVEVMRYT